MVVISPLPPLRQSIRKLWTEAQLMNDMRHGMWDRSIIVAVENMAVHCTSSEAAARSDVEVANDLVHSQNTFDATSFIALLVELLSVPFPLTLFNVLSPPKGPASGSIRLAHLLTGIAAALFDGVCWWLSSVARSTVIRAQLSCLLVFFMSGMSDIRRDVPQLPQGFLLGGISKVKGSSQFEGRDVQHFSTLCNRT